MIIRRLALSIAALSVLSLTLLGCQQEEETSRRPTKEAQEAAGNAAAKARSAAGIVPERNKPEAKTAPSPKAR